MLNQGFKIYNSMAITLIFALMATCISDAQNANESKTEVKPASDIEWQALNPARGDASPQAGTIWGDQTKNGESGFLVKFVDGFSSPPHIHNITYRGIVIGGGLHNDDPKAEPMRMKQDLIGPNPQAKFILRPREGRVSATSRFSRAPTW